MTGSRVKVNLIFHAMHHNLEVFLVVLVLVGGTLRFKFNDRLSGRCRLSHVLELLVTTTEIVMVVEVIVVVVVSTSYP